MVSRLFRVRMGKQVNQTLNFAIKYAIDRKKINEQENFLSSINHNEAKLRIYLGGDSKRSIDEIPIPEIMLGLIECVNNSVSINENDLIREVARIFGLKATSSVTNQIKRVIERLVISKHLELDAGRIKPGKKTKPKFT